MAQFRLSSALPLVHQLFGPVENNRTLSEDGPSLFSVESEADRLNIGPVQTEYEGEYGFTIYKLIEGLPILRWKVGKPPHIWNARAQKTFHLRILNRRHLSHLEIHCHWGPYSITGHRPRQASNLASDEGVWLFIRLHLHDLGSRRLV